MYDFRLNIEGESHGQGSPIAPEEAILEMIF